MEQAQKKTYNCARERPVPIYLSWRSKPHQVGSTRLLLFSHAIFFSFFSLSLSFFLLSFLLLSSPLLKTPGLLGPRRLWFPASDCEYAYPSGWCWSFCSFLLRHDVTTSFDWLLPCIVFDERTSCDVESSGLDFMKFGFVLRPLTFVSFFFFSLWSENSWIVSIARAATAAKVTSR